MTNSEPTLVPGGTGKTGRRAAAGPRELGPHATTRGWTMGWAGGALVVAVVTTGLMAGLFAAFSYAVMPGLGRLGDAEFVAAMQRINVAILNGWFGICFGGALVSSVLAAVLRHGAGRRWIVAGAVLYLLVLVVTMAVSVPLNDKLAAAGTTDPHAAREAFETAWVRWNVVRTVLNTAALACLSWALVLSGRLGG